MHFIYFSKVSSKENTVCYREREREKETVSERYEIVKLLSQRYRINYYFLAFEMLPSTKVVCEYYMIFIFIILQDMLQVELSCLLSRVVASGNVSVFVVFLGLPGFPRFSLLSVVLRESVGCRRCIATL